VGQHGLNCIDHLGLKSSRLLKFRAVTLACESSEDRHYNPPVSTLTSFLCTVFLEIFVQQWHTLQPLGVEERRELLLVLDVVQVAIWIFEKDWARGI
jgi:hypothetical protein